VDHVAHRELDDTVSAQIFDEYFKRLDHGRSFFLASDIEEFSSYRVILDDLLLREGNVDFAFDVYARFLERVRQRLDFVNTRLDQPFDFSLDETVLLDRSEEPWCATRSELDELWRKRIKNNLLVYEMMKTGADEKDAEAPDGAAPDQAAPRADQPPETPPTDGEAQPDSQSRQQTAPAPQADGAEPRQKADAQPAGEAEPTKDASKPADEAERKADAGAPLPVPPKTPKQRVLRFYERYLRQLEENEGMDVLEIFLSAMTRIYDPHSVYMAPDTEQDFDIAMKLSLQGIGALLTTEDAFVKIVGILPGGPAEMDGRLKEGDRIIAVAQDNQEAVDVIDMPLRKVVKMIRGRKGTRVLLTVLEAGKGLGSVPVVIDIVRDQVKLTEQEAKSEVRTIQLPVSVDADQAQAAPATPAKAPEADDEPDAGAAETQAAQPVGDGARVALVFLPSFYTDFQGKHRGLKDYKSSTRDVRRLIDDAAEQDLAGVILDLRSNGGGSLDEAIELAGLFFSEGPVVQVRKTDGTVKKRHDPDPETVYDGPLMLLVDRHSASASEIVAAAIQDYRRGVILGESSTHGKGTVQTVYHLDRKLRRSPIFKGREAGSVKFTMAKFYRVTGGSTQVKGVPPDIVFASFTDHMKLGEAHLPKALPWDEIEPLTFSCHVDVGPYLATLKARSEARLATDEEYQEHLRDIAEFGERRKRKTLPLNKEARIALQKEEEQWGQKLRRTKSAKKRRMAKKKEEDQDEPPRDYVLEEALAIMGDLIVMQGGGALSRTVEVSEVARERDTETTAPAAAARTTE